jgi:hypothetical protein
MSQSLCWGVWHGLLPAAPPLRRPREPSPVEVGGDKAERAGQIQYITMTRKVHVQPESHYRITHQ